MGDPVGCLRGNETVTAEYCNDCWLTAHAMRSKKAPGWDCPQGHVIRLAAAYGLEPTAANYALIRKVATAQSGLGQNTALDDLLAASRKAAHGRRQKKLAGVS
jgi:hypothetical protein